MQTPETNPIRPDVTSHPEPPAWMSYLYGELNAAQRSALNAHLRHCPACQKTVANWRKSIRALDTWKLTRPPAQLPFALPLLKWGFAALLLLGLGYGIGRLSTPAADLENLRAALEQPLKLSLQKSLRNQLQHQFADDLHAALGPDENQITTPARRNLRLALADWRAQTVALTKAETQALIAEFDRAYAQLRQQDQKNTLALANHLQNLYAQLRHDLETVALTSEQSFRVTQTQIGELAAYTPVESDTPAGHLIPNPQMKGPKQ